MSDTADAPVTEPSQPIIALPDKGYRIKFCLFGLALVIGGGWFFRDGFFHWPAQNAELKTLKDQRESAIRAGDTKHSDELFKQIETINGGEEHTNWDIDLQKVLAFALPPIGILLALNTLRKTRGEYRLEGDILHVPGHPPVPLEKIVEIDKHRWERKGIAFLTYELDNAQRGELRIDSYYYSRFPTEAIFNLIEKRLVPDSSDESNPPSEQAPG